MAEEQKRRTVRVGCTIPNGLMINLWKKGFDDGTGDGQSQMIHDGPGVRLNGPSALNTGVGASHRSDLHEVTDVDAEFWGKWIEQNKLNPYLAEGCIYEVKEETPAQNPTP